MALRNVIEDDVNADLQSADFDTPRDIVRRTVARIAERSDGLRVYHVAGPERSKGSQRAVFTVFLEQQEDGHAYSGRDAVIIAIWPGGQVRFGYAGSAGRWLRSDR